MSAGGNMYIFYIIIIPNSMYHRVQLSLLEIIRWLSYVLQSNLVNMKLQGTIKNVHSISVIVPGDFKVVRIKQVFRFNSVCINEVPLLF